MNTLTPSDSAADPPVGVGRYARQARFVPFGDAGQKALASSSALVCGCGALGSAAAELLVRAGVGRVVLVDRDFVEMSNLHRQTLFDERDADQQLPKAVAAAAHLKQINSQIDIEANVADVTAANLPALAAAVDVIVDGLDNFDTRYLINDFSVKQNIPWVFGGCVGAEGQSMTILPGETACLACLLPEPPPVELQPTCETTGVLGPIVSLIASLESLEAIKILSGNRSAVNRSMTVVDLWCNQWRTIAIDQGGAAAKCRCCGDRDFPWLEGRRGAGAVVLCGRNAVQIAPQGPPPSLADLETKVALLGVVTRNAFLLRLDVPPHQITIFADGRSIVSGTDDPSAARALLAKFIGS